MTGKLSSLGISRLHDATRTTKIVQLLDAPSERDVMTKLGELVATGILTFTSSANNRLELQWEPRVFPKDGVKPQAKQALDPAVHDLRLAFDSQLARETFEHWLFGSGLLTL